MNTVIIINVKTVHVLYDKFSEMWFTYANKVFVCNRSLKFPEQNQRFKLLVLVKGDFGLVLSLHKLKKKILSTDGSDLYHVFRYKRLDKILIMVYEQTPQ